jgi:hypothetical protein
MCHWQWIKFKRFWNPSLFPYENYVQDYIYEDILVNFSKLVDFASKLKLNCRTS